MVNVYRSKKPLSNQDIMGGICIRNNNAYVEEGMDEIFRNIKWVKRMLESGDLAFAGSDEQTETPVEPPKPQTRPTLAEPVKPSLTIKAAYKIAESEYHVSRPQLKDWIDSGEIPGKDGSRLNISEGEFRAKLGELVENIEPKVEPEPEE